MPHYFKLHDKGLNWAKLPEKWKKGTFIIRNDETKEWEAKHFEVVKNRNIIEQFNEEKKEDDVS